MTLMIVLGAAGLAVALVIAVTWVLVASRSGTAGGVWAGKAAARPSGGTGPAPVLCGFHSVSTSSSRPDVGVPDQTDDRRSGTVTMTITTNLGVIEVRMDAAKTPCTIA